MQRHVYPSGYSKTAADTTSVSQTGSDTTQTAISPTENLSSIEVTSSEKSVELPMPVEDHFKTANSDENKSVVVQDTNDEQLVTSSKGEKIKAFTKKLKFWSRTGDKSPNNDTESEAAADGSVSPSDEKMPKSVEDEIEAILSAPKKTKKQTAKNSPVDKISAKVTPVDLNNSGEDRSTVTDRKQPLTTRNDAKQKTSSQVKMADGEKTERAATTQELKEAKNETSRQSASVDNNSVKPAPSPVKQKPMIAVKPKPSLRPQVTSKPQAHIAPIQKEGPLKMESLLKQLEQKVAENDYYQLLGLEESASAEDIARRRRERSQELHPDHFMTDAVQKAK